MRKSLTFYDTKFDLSTLAIHTNASITQDVIVKADTVYMSQPLDVTYQLSIQARVVSIDKPLTMTIRSEEFNLARMRTKHEKKVSFNNVLNLRHRKFGLVEIIDVFPSSKANSQCINSESIFFADLNNTFMIKYFLGTPIKINSTDLDVKSWYDRTLLNLIYVCARTLLSKEINTGLALSIANYTLDLHSNRDVTGDVRIFAAAQKFKKVLELGQHRQAHNVST